MGKKKGGVRVKQVGPKNAAPMINPMEAFQPPTEALQEIHLPQAPDRSYQIVWPIHETFTLKTEGFSMIYPTYLDSNKTVAQGRRVCQALAVPAPTVADLSQALQKLGIRHVLQPYKCYSRDSAWENPGRILVDCSLYNKRQLLPLLCEKMVDLPDRMARIQREQQQRLEQEEMAESTAAKPATAATVTSKNKATTNKKKAGGSNKKKK